MFNKIIYVAVIILACVVVFKLYEIAGARTVLFDAPVSRVAVDSDDADLRAVVFVDYFCTGCKEIYPELIKAAKEDGKVQVIVHPINSDGELAAKLVRLVYAAESQGKFMDLHNEFISSKGMIRESDLPEIYSKLGIDESKLDEAYEDKDLDKMFEKYNKAVTTLGIYFSPTLLIENLVYTPDADIPDAEQIKELFAEARGKK